MSHGGGNRRSDWDNRWRDHGIEAADARILKQRLAVGPGQRSDYLHRLARLDGWLRFGFQLNRQAIETAD